MKFVIDRIAGAWAICEAEDRGQVRIPVSSIQEEAGEGDIVVEDQGVFRIDREETQKRRDQMKKRLRDLL